MIYAIGDIHGELRKLKGLLGLIKESGLEANDRLVFVGDYIDRGADTPGVIDLLIEIGKERPNTIFLRGNHDQGMLDAREFFEKKPRTALTFNDVSWWFSFGGKETIESYPKGNPWYTRIPDHHWEFLQSTWMEFAEGNYAFVHAGYVPPGQHWKEKEDPRMWIRELFIGSKANFGKTVVFGHTPQDLQIPLVMENKVGIDTGAAYGGPLTALKLDPAIPYNREKLNFIYFS